MLRAVYQINTVNPVMRDCCVVCWEVMETILVNLLTGKSPCVCFWFKACMQSMIQFTINYFTHSWWFWLFNRLWHRMTQRGEVMSCWCFKHSFWNGFIFIWVSIYLVSLHKHVHTRSIQLKGAVSWQSSSFWCILPILALNHYVT